MKYNNLKEYLGSNSFTKAIEENREELISSRVLEKFLVNNNVGDLIKFSQEFWKDPSQSVKELKDKYGITGNVGYSEIVRSFETSEYLEFLSDYYKEGCNSQFLSQKYNVPYNKINDLIVDIKYECDKFCSRCLNNKYYVKIVEGNCVLQCFHCMLKSKENELIDEEMAIALLEANEKQADDFKKRIDEIKKELEDVKCPKCQDNLLIYDDKKKLIYSIKCNNCGFKSSDIDDTKKLYNQFKKRAAMMINIKQKEFELVEDILKIKDESDIMVKKEELITQIFCRNAIEHIFNNYNIDDEIIWRDYIKVIRTCKRIERIILYSLLDETKKINNIIPITYKDKKITVYQYCPEQPIIMELMKITKVIVVRQVLKQLVEKNLIIIDEEMNHIFIPTVLINNMETIKNLLEQQNINSAIRYLIFERQKFSCYTCGETGRPFKIAYLNSLKNSNDLSSMIAICDHCQEIVTKNEILIDATISIDKDSNVEYYSVLWEFIVTYLPQVEESQEIYDKLKVWSKDYDENNIIKALAISINKMLSGDSDGTINFLINYTSGILKNGEVSTWKKLSDRFKLDEWIDKL